MPNRPLKPCSHYGCPNLTSERFCPEHKQEERPYAQVADRPSAHKRGYDRRWQAARAGYLRQHPLCAECGRNGTNKLATLVDHIKPHRGDPVLFWDSQNWQSLCDDCHNIKTAQELQR